jgi:hypothetical protein
MPGAKYPGDHSSLVAEEKIADRRRHCGTAADGAAYTKSGTDAKEWSWTNP